jgi:hypothetical protein
MILRGAGSKGEMRRSGGLARRAPTPHAGVVRDGSAKAVNGGGAP